MTNRNLTTKLTRRAWTRLNESEYQLWVQRTDAGDMTRARLMRKWVREFITGYPDLTGVELQAFKEAVRQVAAIGRNLNQLAHAVHKGEKVFQGPAEVLIRDALARVLEIENHLGVILETTRKRKV